ncbi:hypothetical protein ACFYSH_00810 [Streptomyces sp. NPDC005791]|uniref:hypothetical protein n=1 Tax=Streptomyces sp. NPDC005791 TaxID=3364732 RepID=UPI0036BB6924
MRGALCTCAGAEGAEAAEEDTGAPRPGREPGTFRAACAPGGVTPGKVFTGRAAADGGAVAAAGLWASRTARWTGADVPEGAAGAAAGAGRGAGAAGPRVDGTAPRTGACASEEPAGAEAGDVVRPAPVSSGPAGAAGRASERCTGG